MTKTSWKAAKYLLQDKMIYIHTTVERLPALVTVKKKGKNKK